MGHRYRDPANNLLGFPRGTSYLVRRYTEICYIYIRLAGAIAPSRLAANRRKTVSNILRSDFAVLSNCLFTGEILWIGGVSSLIGGKIRPKIRS